MVGCRGFPEDAYASTRLRAGKPNFFDRGRRRRRVLGGVHLADQRQVRGNVAFPEWHGIKQFPGSLNAGGFSEVCGGVG